MNEGLLLRVLEPTGPWEPTGSAAERVTAFWSHGETSVYDVSVCPPERIFFVFYALRSKLPPAEAWAFRFHKDEAEDESGKVTDSPSDPPWPHDYSEAHKDLYDPWGTVATEMERLYEEQTSTRLQTMPRECLLTGIARIWHEAQLSGQLPNSRVKRTLKHLTRLLPEEATLFGRIAESVPSLLDDSAVQSAFRKLYNSHRPLWNQLADTLPRLRESPPGQFR